MIACTVGIAGSRSPSRDMLGDAPYCSPPRRPLAGVEGYALRNRGVPSMTPIYCSLTTMSQPFTPVFVSYSHLRKSICVRFGSSPTSQHSALLFPSTQMLTLVSSACPVFFFPLHDHARLKFALLPRKPSADALHALQLFKTTNQINSNFPPRLPE